MITESPALLARERQVFDRYAEALATLIGDEIGSAAGDVEPRAVAKALLGVHRALIDYSRDWVGLDNSAEMLARAPAPAVTGEAVALPFPNVSFGSVALLYVLYHVAEPVRALAEAKRVLRPGGLVAVAAPSRHDSPELAYALPDRPLTFDAELAPGMVEELFAEVEVERWDAPLLELPDREAVCDYLVGKGVPREQARLAGDTVETPLMVTKRGALLLARKR